MVLRQTPVFDYVPHCIRREIIIRERDRMEKGCIVTVSNIMDHYAINREAAESIMRNIKEKREI